MYAKEYYPAKIMNYSMPQSEWISVNFASEKPDTDDKTVYDPIKVFQEQAKINLWC